MVDHVRLTWRSSFQLEEEVLDTADGWISYVLHLDIIVSFQELNAN